MKVLRRLGIGDLQHVRSQLLSVACFDTENLIQHVAAAFALGDQLNMMARVHVNAAICSPSVQTELLNLCLRNLSHQLEAWDIDTKNLEKKLLTCDIIIQGEKTLPRLVDSSFDVEVGNPFKTLKHVWNEWGGRMLNGNHGRLTIDDLEASPFTSHLVGKIA